MATLIAYSPEPATQHFVDHLATLLKSQRGVTLAVEDLARAGRYIDNVDAVIVVAEANDETYNHVARNFLTAQYAELADKSLFIVGLGTTTGLSETQQTAMDAFDPRDTAYFRTDALDESALNTWVGQINTKGVV